MNYENKQMKNNVKGKKSIMQQQVDLEHKFMNLHKIMVLFIWIYCSQNMYPDSGKIV